VFGTPVDITLAELALESFFPADAATGEALRAMAGLRAGETAGAAPNGWRDRAGVSPRASPSEKENP
jgi:hypothetical protein